MIKDIKELNFPAYATLETATATISDMGDRTITSQVKIDGDVVPDFSYDWEVEFKGERYIHPVKTPQGTKDNTSRKSKIDLVFQHWAIYEMKRQYFVEMASTSAGTAIADKYIASLGLNLGDFVTAFNLILNHYFDDRIVIRLNPEWQYDAEAKFVSISYSYIWDVLQQMHEIYGVRWTIKTNADGVCEILMGYPAEEVSHIFEYGFEGGLLSVQRQVQSTEIRNRLLGRGGSKNLPYRYFKDKDPNNPLFEADPDWIPELANIAFTELRGKTFRNYVRGWKAKRYGGTPMAEPTEAYLAGYNAEKFDPIEYVDDKESIEKYGVLVGALENNEEIYPSIQGAPGDVDMIVDAEQVTDDNVDAAVENDSVTTNLESGHQTYRNAPANSVVTIETLTKRYFSVPEGKVGNLSMSLTATGKYSNFGDYEETHPILKSDTVKVTIHDKITGVEVRSSSVPVVDIPAGDYYYMISVDVETNYDRTSMVTLNIESVYLYTSTPNKSEGWKQTFDIWVRNIWGSERNAGETDQQYADRVWLPILGDRMGDEARVVFASGWLSFSSGWEFPIVGYAYDDSKEGSHWRLTLAKSEAELEASGKYIPYEGYNASAGDRFFFIGIDMPWQYVYWGEERIDDYKRDTLPETAWINPSWVIKTDKVRLNQNREGAKLIDSLSVGAQIRLASKQFISGAYESLYVQSMTYNWTADTILYPDVEVVVSDKVHTVKNPVAQIQGNIETLQRQMGSLSNIQQIIRQVCDQLYLRKDGIEDLSKSPTRFLGKVTGEKFRQGQIGGKDWGIYRDENGNAILEADKFVARQGILVTDLVVNEATYVGGLQIRSAAHMDVTSVEDTEAGYVCSFDQKQGSVTNKFTEDDVVLCQKFDADQSEVKFYKRRVVSVSETSVTLSKADVNGTGVPAEGDVIIHYGNYTDKSRQFVIISDVIGGGYERMLMGLDSVTSDGVEYYFAGKSADSKARWFVGGTEQFAEYKDGQLTIKGNIFVTGSDKNISEQLAQIDFIREAFGENAQGLVLGTAIIVGYTDENENFVPMAGLSGVYDKDVENGGPAAWYGGTPEDAKSVIFMDGTGYFADGLFKWDKNKGVNLGNDAIKINYDGSVDFGGNIRIGNTGEETLDSLLTIVAGLTEMWHLDEDGNVCTDRNVIIAGDTSSGGEGQDTPAEGTVTGIEVNGTPYEPNTQGVIDLSAAFNAIDVSDQLENYYTKPQTDSAISTAIAGLINGAPTTLDTLKEIADALAKNKDVVDALDEAIDKKADKATTLAEYGITDANISNGVITLGMNTITPLTSHQTIYSLRLNNSAGEQIVKFEPNVKSSEINLTKAMVGLDLVENTKLSTWAGTNNITTLGTITSGTWQGSRVSKSYLDSDLVAWFDAVSPLLVKDSSGNIKVSTNLIVTGDTSSGGSGSDTPASGTVTGIKVSATQTLEPNTAGVIDMVNTLASIDVSDQLKDYAKLTDIPSLDGYATETWVTNNYLSSITKNMVDSVLGGTTSSNANKFLMCTGSTTVWSAVTKSMVATALGASTGGRYLIDTGGDLGWGTIPTKLSQFTDDVVSGKYLPLSGGTLQNGASTAPLILNTTSSTEIGIKLNMSGVNKGWVGYSASTGYGTYLYNSASSKYIGITDGGTPHYQGNTLLHSGNYSSYALPLSGGTIEGNYDVLKIKRNANYASLIKFENTSGSMGYLGFSNPNVPAWYSSDVATSYTLIHSGNIGSQNAGSATKLQTARTIWGQSFDGTGNVSGSLYLGTGTIRSSKSGTDRVFVDFGSAGDPYIGYGIASAGIDSHLCGNNIYLHYGTSRTNGLILNSSGNVLIGTITDNSSGKLQIEGGATLNGYMTSGAVSKIADLGEKGLVVSTGSNRINWGMALWTEGNGKGYIQQQSFASAATTYALCLQPFGGNVGIGTTSPAAYRLDVIGVVRATGGFKSTAISIECDSNGNTSGYGGEINRLGGGQLWIQSREGGLQLGNADSISNFNGAVTMSSYLSVLGPLVITGTSAVSANLRFSRQSANYITAPSGGSVYIDVSGGASSASSSLRVTSSHVSKGSGLTVDLGESSNPWSTIYGVNGIFSGDTSSGSDIRFKDIIKNKTLKIEHIAKAPLFTFKWNDRDDDAIHLGSSAQYWEKVCPWLVTGEDFKSLNYATLGVAMGISLAKKAVNHEERIKVLEKENKALKEEIRRMQYGS